MRGLSAVIATGMPQWTTSHNKAGKLLASLRLGKNSAVSSAKGVLIFAVSLKGAHSNLTD